VSFLAFNGPRAAFASITAKSASRLDGFRKPLVVTTSNLISGCCNRNLARLGATTHVAKPSDKLSRTVPAKRLFSPVSALLAAMIERSASSACFSNSTPLVVSRCTAAPFRTDMCRAYWKAVQVCAPPPRCCVNGKDFGGGSQRSRLCHCHVKTQIIPIHIILILHKCSFMMR
jgi:hypothetical protein